MDNLLFLTAIVGAEGPHPVASRKPETNTGKRCLMQPPSLMTDPTMTEPVVPVDVPDGEYLEGTVVKTVDGVKTSTKVLYALPNPGGTLGWNSLLKSFYVVPAN